MLLSVLFVCICCSCFVGFCGFVLLFDVFCCFGCVSNDEPLGYSMPRELQKNYKKEVQNSAKRLQLNIKIQKLV